MMKTGLSILVLVFSVCVALFIGRQTAPTTDTTNNSDQQCSDRVAHYQTLLAESGYREDRYGKMVEEALDIIRKWRVYATYLETDLKAMDLPTPAPTMHQIKP